METTSNRIRSLNFGAVFVGGSVMRNLTVRNPFNETVEIALIRTVDHKEATFQILPQWRHLDGTIDSRGGDRNRFRQRYRVVLAPYSEGVIGPIEFRPRSPATFRQLLYLRNNVTMIEPFNVSGTGKQHRIRVLTDSQTPDDKDGEDGDDEKLRVWMEEEEDLMYVLPPFLKDGMI